MRVLWKDLSRQLFVFLDVSEAKRLKFVYDRAVSLI